MKFAFVLILFLIYPCLPAHARYYCQASSATNEVFYSATKMNDNFSKTESIEFGKVVGKDNVSVYYVIPQFTGKSFGKLFLSDKAKIIVDGTVFVLEKDTNAKHVSVKKYSSGRSNLFAEYSVPKSAAEKIKTSSGLIIFSFEIEGRGEKILDFGLKTSDEIRFIAKRQYEDFIAVSKKQLVPKYTEP